MKFPSLSTVRDSDMHCRPSQYAYTAVLIPETSGLRVDNLRISKNRYQDAFFLGLFQLFFFCLFLFLAAASTCRIFVPWPGIEHTPPALGAWTAREVPVFFYFVHYLLRSTAEQVGETQKGGSQHKGLYNMNYFYHVLFKTVFITHTLFEGNKKSTSIAPYIVKFIHPYFKIFKY